MTGGEGEYIYRYCAYGAVSRAQFDRCATEVTAEEIRRRDTNAADFAALKLMRCRDDAGPFCEAEAERQSYLLDLEQP